jgi:uncharacterized membrane protein YhhN
VTTSGRERGTGRATAPQRVLTAAVVVSLALHLRAAHFGPAWQVYLFKPVTTSLLLVMALGLSRAAARDGGPRPGYHALICAGLLWSLAGDIFLMLPEDRFLAGLASFLAAHLCYIAAFARGVPWNRGALLAVPYAAAAGGLITALWPHLGALRGAVVVYGGVLAAMAWRAGVRWSVQRTGPAAAAALGGALFMVSDATLAIDRFAAPFAAATIVVMTTYIAAQWLIVASMREDVSRA